MLHPVAGAADVQVHLVVSRLLGEPRRRRQLRRHAAAQLQRQGMLALVMAQETLPVAMQQRAGGDHLGVEQGMAGKLAQKKTTVTVGPIHHRRHGEAAGQGRVRGFWL
ncbi:hypothetical protein D3C76_1668320 [compost metagenome]